MSKVTKLKTRDSAAVRADTFPRTMVLNHLYANMEALWDIHAQIDLLASSLFDKADDGLGVEETYSAGRVADVCRKMLRARIESMDVIVQYRERETEGGAA